MSNSNHSAKFINMLIALMASIAIALTCIVPTALAEDGDGTDDNNGGSTVQPAGPVPNIIITNFTYGDGSVAVGTNFDLGFTFQNMGKVAVGNMVVTVDGGENFAISGGTNTFYYDSLWAGYSLTQTVPMQVLSSAKNGAQGIDINFKYEYVDGGTRNSNTSDIKISVPVSQPDRFELGDPVLPDAINAGEESTISMEYVNKGKGDVSNVEASIEGDGITATQMDIKVDGLSYEVLAAALEQARKGRLHILDILTDCIAAPRADYKPFVPRLVQIHIPKDSIGAVIGPGGKVIQEIQKQTGTTITITEDDQKGIVDVFGVEKSAIDAALQRIKEIVAVPEIGETYHGKIKSIVPFGAFVEIMPGKEALLHISEIDWKRFETMEESGLKEGDEIDVKLIGLDPKTNKLKLSRKALLPKPEGYVERERRPRGDRERRRDDRHRD